MFLQPPVHLIQSPTSDHFSIGSSFELGSSNPSAEANNRSGRIFSKYFCLYSEKKLEIFSKSDGSLKSIYSPLYATDVIRCVTEYTLHSHLTLNHLFLISTSRSTQGPHFILLFNPEVSRVIKAIQVAFSPECICPLTKSGTLRDTSKCGYREWPLIEVSHGLVAIGGGSGTVVLIDLRLDDEEEVFGEETPSEATTYFSDMITDFVTLQQVRIECIAEQSHPSYILPGIRIPPERNFNFKIPSQEDIVFPSNEVIITCLVQLHTICALAVGYNMGVFQLYDVINLQLFFSSEVDNFPSPVLHVLYQEPEDDPRDFVYLWIVRGSEKSSLNTSPSHAIISLYQFLFHSSQIIYLENGNMYLRTKEFSRFLDGGLKFRHFLSSSPFIKQISKSKDSHVLYSGIFPQCKIIQEQDLNPNIEKPDLEIFSHSCHTQDLTLAYFLYYTTESDYHNGLYLALFDLNIWYYSQMQSDISNNSNFYSVFDLKQCFVHSHSQEQSQIQIPFNVLDFKLTSLKRFNLNTPIPEVFLLPSSLSISMDFLFSSAFTSCLMLGKQDKVISQVSDILSNCCTDEINSVCLSLMQSGIIPSERYNIDSQAVMYWEDSVIMLLNASLEFSYIEPIYTCILNAQNQCGDIPLILISNWTLIKFDEIRDSLIFRSNELLSKYPSCDSNISISIRSLLYKLHNISLILSRIPSAHLSINYPSHSTPDYQKSIDVLHVYNETLLWLVAQPLSVHSSYHYKNMKTHYQKLRKYHNSDLIIDRIISQLNPAIFNKWIFSQSCEKELMGNQRVAAYPPISPLAIVEGFLDISHPEFGQISLLYFLVDLGMQLDDLSTESLTISFMKNFSQIPDRLPSLAYSFWLIDNAHYQNGIVELLSVPSYIVDLFNFAFPNVLDSLLKSDHSYLLHLLISVHRPIMDTLTLFQLYLQILMKSGNLCDALKQLYNFFPIGSTHESLDELLASCELPALKRLVCMPLNSIILSQVVDFLHNRDTFLNYEILIMILLKQNKIVSGIQTYRLTKSSMNALAQSEEEKSRLSLLDQLIQAFSDISACDLEYASRTSSEHRSLKREISAPTPLSTKVRKRQTSNGTNKKELLESIHDKVSELKQAKYTYEEIHLSSPSRICHKYKPRLRYKRLSELTYPSPIEPQNESLPNITNFTVNGTPLKLAFDRYINQNSPKVSSLLPPPSLIRTLPLSFSPSNCSLDASLNPKQTTPSSILKTATPKKGVDLDLINFNTSETTSIFRNRKTRFNLPSSNTENVDEEENDNAYQSPLSSPKDFSKSTPIQHSLYDVENSTTAIKGSSPVIQPYYSPVQDPEEILTSEYPKSSSFSPIDFTKPSLDIIPAAEFTPILQSDHTSPIIVSNSIPTLDILQIDNNFPDSRRSSGNIVTGHENLSEEFSDPLNYPTQLTKTKILVTENELPCDNLEEEFGLLCQMKSFNYDKPLEMQHSLEIPELSKFIPEIEKFDKSSRVEQIKRFSPNSDSYPLSKYTPFSVDDEKNKIFASLQLGECPFIIPSSSVPSQKEIFLPLRSVETTTASYITQDTNFANLSNPSSRSSRSIRPKSSQSKRSDKDPHTPHKQPQHHYNTRAKAPCTPKLQVRVSPINLLPTLPAEKQTKPPKVTLFNKLGTLRRSQRLKERESTTD